jgi:hypothetical protein
MIGSISELLIKIGPIMKEKIMKKISMFGKKDNGA